MMSELESEQKEQKEASLELERIIFFSDAVIAIAITLLAVQIVLPVNLNAEDVPQAIINMIPQMAAYTLSFLIIGNYWVIHHRVFRNIRHYDTRLIWLNILFLLFMAFLPVPSNVIGRFPTEPAAIIFFDICLMLTGLTQAAIWLHASHDYHLIPRSLSPALIRWGTIRSLIPPGVMVISIILAFFDPLVALLSWVLIWVEFAVWNRFFPR
jgi:uncharacterized membrane protein